VQVHRDLAYGPHQERNTLDVYVPKTDKPLPLLVWIHGGGWQAGSKDGRNPAVMLLKRGYVVASINYRLSSHDTYPAQIHDCKAAIRYLRANAKKFQIDPDHIGVWGASAGGHLVALLGTTGDVKELEGSVGDHPGVSSRVQAVCNWFGPTDLTKINPNTASGAVPKLLGGSIAEKGDVAKLASPVTFATKDDAPTLTIHGTQDPLVPLAHAEYLDEALKKAGVPSTVIVLEGSGHGGPAFLTPEMFDKTDAFFRKHLGGPTKE
jgi:acetyl esterase/lipase